MSLPTTMTAALSAEELRQIDAYWRAANYLSVGQVYLLDNPLLREPLRPEHIKPRLLGHFGTVPGLNLIYVHLNRAIRQRDLDAIYITGPGHGGPAVVANAWLEGTYTELYPTSAVTNMGYSTCSASFRSPAGSRVTRLPRLPARSMRAASSATPFLTPSAPPSTTRICWSPASSETVRRKRGRWRRVAREQVPQRAHRRRRAAGPAPQRLQDRESHGAGANDR